MLCASEVLTFDNLKFERQKVLSAENVNAIIVGLIIGLVLGLLKTWLLWFRGNPFQAKDQSRQPDAQGIVNRSLLSYFINIIILGLVYLIRPVFSLPLAPLIIAAATGLIACGLIYPLQNLFRK